MRHALLINAHFPYDILSEGNLTNSIFNHTKEFLVSKGFDLQTTIIKDGYNIDDELEKLNWAYYVFFQFPVWWFGLPHEAKKYIDEVFSAGQGKVTFENDGRKRNDPNRHYGQGGLLKNKHYMLSATLNAPKDAFENEAAFFGGLDFDESMCGVHKVFQFCGMIKIPSFVIYDVYKGDIDISKQAEDLEKILRTNFL